MDNGHHCTCNLINSIKENKFKQFFDDRQNIPNDSTSLRQSRSAVWINEVDQDNRIAILRRVEATVAAAANVDERCSYCDRLNCDKENQNWNFCEWTNRGNNTTDNQRHLRCERCKKLNFIRSAIDVMMKNKSCGGDDAHSVAMETDIIGSSCNGNSTSNAADNNAAPGNNRLMTNENVLDHLKGMSLSDRRASITPRITLTNVEEDDEGGAASKKQNPYHGDEEEAMITDDDHCSSPLSPRFLAVPKIEELGPERRPPQMVKTM